MSNLREFDVTQINIGGRTARGHKVTCGRCGVVHREAVNTESYHTSGDDVQHRWIRRKFEKAGWLVGKRERDDRCGGCVVIEAKEKKVMNGQHHKAPSHPPAPALSAPKLVVAVAKLDLAETRKMQREDRRLIFEKLNDVYADESTGYGPGWTDRKLAEDLGVPRQWVETIREENFGPVRTNPEITDAVNEANKVLAQARELVQAVQVAKATLANVLKPIEEKMGPMQALLDRTERSIADLEKSVG